MNILFDGRSMTRTHTSGIPEYTKLLFLHLLRFDSLDEHYMLFLNSFRKRTLPKEFIGKNINIINWKIPNRFIEFSSRAFAFPRVGVFQKIDALFRPHFHPLRVARGVKDILVIHDLSFVKYPEFFSKKKAFWHWVQNPKAQAKRADHIITISSAMKDDIVNFYNIDPKKISVVYSGINDFFRHQISEEEKNQFKKMNNIHGRFLLFSGTLEPRKNIEGIIRAFSRFKEKKDVSDVSLIIVGARGWLYDKILKERTMSPYASQIRLWGHASFEDLRYLYSSASAFVFPSFFEGFGFPPLEAQAQGLPVIASLEGGLKETLNNSVYAVDPHSDEDIAEAMYKVISDEVLRRNLIQRGKENSMRFYWSDTAGKIRAIIQNILFL